MHIKYHAVVKLFKNHTVQSKYIQFLFVNHTSIKLGEGGRGNIKI